MLDASQERGLGFNVLLRGGGKTEELLLGLQELILRAC
jgi:hypothetical protein